MECQPRCLEVVVLYLDLLPLSSSDFTATSSIFHGRRTMLAACGKAADWLRGSTIHARSQVSRTIAVMIGLPAPSVIIPAGQ